MHVVPDFEHYMHSQVNLITFGEMQKSSTI